MVNGRGDEPNRHDILTGSLADGTAAPETCEDWTSGGADTAGIVGHHDRMGLDDSPTGTSWNAVPHLARRLRPRGAARHRRRRAVLLLRDRLRPAMAHDPGAALRALHRPGEPFVLMNAWDRGSARVMAALGAQAIGTTSAGFAFTLGLPDGAGSPATRRSATPRTWWRRRGCRSAPTSRTAMPRRRRGSARPIRLAGEAGLAGASIEDTDLPGAGAYWFDLAVERVRAAVSAARALGRDFVLVARADGLMTGGYDLNEAIAGCRPSSRPAPTASMRRCCPTSRTVAPVCAAVRGPVNVLAAGPLARASRAELAKAGVARISLGSGLARLAQAA